MSGLTMDGAPRAGRPAGRGHGRARRLGRAGDAGGPASRCSSGSTLAFDWMFVNEYFHRYLGENPFGHRALDIKAYAMGREGGAFADTSLAGLVERYGGTPTLTHHALEDARVQADLFAPPARPAEVTGSDGRPDATVRFDGRARLPDLPPRTPTPRRLRTTASRPRASATGSSGRSGCGPTARRSTRSSTDDVRGVRPRPVGRARVHPGARRRGRPRSVIVGGGFAGMLTAKGLLERGITDFRIVDKAGDFGGTWYWNRYPGCMCDVESLIYLPLLEETGYCPTMRYTPRHGDLRALPAHRPPVRPLPARPVPDRDRHRRRGTRPRRRWQVTTSRGDELSARFLITAGGILHKAKLPAIEGITDFAGRAFHTARWDYGYTGGSPTEPMDRLADKRVGIIGTGATVDPGRAAAGPGGQGGLRLPAHAVRRRRAGQRARSTRRGSTRQEPGWQLERMRNFTAAVTGEQPEREPRRRRLRPRCSGRTPSCRPTRPRRPPSSSRPTSRSMESLRARIDEVIDDPATAETLKPWYGKHCKRLCFHDDYLAGLQRAERAPRRHQRPGRAARSPPQGPVVDGTQYELDLLVYASGFEVTTGLVSRLGFDPVGRDGVQLSERWARRRPHAARRADQRLPEPARLPLHPGRLRPELPPLPERADRPPRVDRGHRRRGRTSPRSRPRWRPRTSGSPCSGRPARASAATPPPARPASTTARAPARWRPPATSCTPATSCATPTTSRRWRDAGDLPGTTVGRAGD